MLKVTIHVRLESRLARHLAAAAKSEQRSVTEVARMILREHFARQEAPGVAA